MENKDKTERLKKLIKESASFTDEDKHQLIAKIPELNVPEVDEAIQVLEEEMAEWKALYETNEENKVWLKDHLSTSQKEISEMANKLTQEADSEQAEELLKSVS